MARIIVAAKLRELRVRSGVSMAAAAKALGYKNASSYQHYENPDLFRKKYLPFEIAEKLAKLFMGRGTPPITTAEVMALAGPIIDNLTDFESPENEHVSSEDVAATLPGNDHHKTLSKSSLENYTGQLPGSVPEIDAKAGAGTGNVGEHEVVTLRRGETFVGHKVISEWVFPSNFLRHELHIEAGGIMVLEVVGDSMSPTLESGDRIIIDTSYSKPTPDGIYVIEEGDGPMVKRLQLVRRTEPPEVRIIADNKHHEPYTLRLDDIRIIGRVSGRVTKM